jgi:hypothetical protein
LPQNFSNQKTAGDTAVLELLNLLSEFFNLRGQRKPTIVEIRFA